MTWTFSTGIKISFKTDRQTDRNQIIYTNCIPSPNRLCLNKLYLVLPVVLAVSHIGQEFGSCISNTFGLAILRKLIIEVYGCMNMIWKWLKNTIKIKIN